jgi:hypothetical protein
VSAAVRLLSLLFANLDLGVLYGAPEGVYAKQQLSASGQCALAVQHETIQDDTRRYKTIQDDTKRYKTIQNDKRRDRQMAGLHATQSARPHTSQLLREYSRVICSQT